MTRRNPIEDLALLRHEFGEHGGVNMSIEASSTFTVMDPHTMPEMFQGRKGPENAGCYLYGRHFNPTVYNLSRQLAALEGTESAYCTASGMGAISATLMALCGHGDHIVSSNTVYGGSYALMHYFLPATAGVTTCFVNISDLDAVRAAITDDTRVLYVESVANPTLRVADIPRLAEIADDAGITLVVDNTFSPLILSPAALGADVVVHSMTKFISGMSDIIAGAVCGSHAFIEQLMDLHSGPLMLLGPTMDPKTAAELSLRIPHLPLRMVAHGERALALAERLEAVGVDVCYPGLAGHPDRALLDRLRCPDYGYGGVLTIDLGEEERADKLMALLQNKYCFGFMAVSLGYFDTLMSCSGASTSSEMSDGDKAAAGIGPGLVRMSIGYTGTLEQRWGQLEAALRDIGCFAAYSRAG
ncbi:MAG: aminotransferase class I/II-fold pyridoxal phosphate-dependent enzyme [Gammaproteobacteria bacterium]|nr:aminotransferase class I/II-fold pyridoxal phosphate-dependent enzyme [Gammaproteobacteria bacterium]MDH3431718.1 aminotransferase class I/II-fold pyridoxal phosphate-dependent enzyme [Gammaproteobacteria bacterium]MDH3432766.1 aminotransferase class I/II-fold pyridoxal phosphate-dependent enzyme [Gammaproteobacteria bacterium]